MDCSYVSVVTAPSHESGGCTTHTCTVCGYSYVSDYTPAITGHIITFSVPLAFEQPDDLICDNYSSVTLPTLAAPEGCAFLGWVKQPYDNVDVCPAEIYTGSDARSRPLLRNDNSIHRLRQ